MPEPRENGGVQTDKGRRRSMRVMLSVGITVQGQLLDGNPFSEETQTLVVNAHGALIHLRSEVKANQKISMTHAKTGERRECRIVYVGAIQGGKAQVGIEFAKPSPSFWQISFPPEDWNVTED